MSKKIIVLLVLILIILAVVFINKRLTAPAVPSGETATSSVSTATSSGSYSMADVATHSTAQSCWTAIRGQAYDLTAWINKHPGGASAILSLCGKDGTVAFTNQHGGQPRPEQELIGFEIGVLR